RDLARLVETLAAYQPPEPSGDPDSLIEYDRSLHMKFGMLNTVISTQASCQEAARMLRSCLPTAALESDPRGWERTAVPLHRLLLAGYIPELRRILPSLLKELARRPLLYVPLDKGGKP